MPIQVLPPHIADLIAADPAIESVKIQSVLTTEAASGVPPKAYGMDMATREIVKLSEPVGVIAAQSVGEPGTQLTLDTKHSSGVAGSGAISRGLPRVEELLEARQPKGQAFITPISGIVNIWEDGKYYIVQITPEAGKTEKFSLEGRRPKCKDGAQVKIGDVIASRNKGVDPITAPFDANVQLLEGEMLLVANAGAPVKVEIPGDYQLFIKAGDTVEAGDRLSEGSLNLQDLMKFKGIEATERYIMNDILAIYATQGQEIADKHLEIIIRQMFSRVIIEEPGDSDLVTGDIISKSIAVETNKRLATEGKAPCTFTQLLLGISKVAIYSDSFLSAASFQDTTRVLINSAISGRIDHLRGLKENVIIGRKIPVGTGINPLSSFEPAPTPAQSAEPTAEDVADL